MLGAGAALSACATASEPLDAPLRMPDMPLHDPWIVADRTTRTYWLYTSNEERMTGVSGVGTMAYRSHDLLNWTRPGVVFQMPTSSIWANAGGWAPEVHFYRGRYWLFTTLHNNSMPLPPTIPPRAPYRRGTVAAVSDTLAGPFTLVNNGEPVAPSSLMTLDGTLYIDRAGRPWFVYAHEWLHYSLGTMEAIPLTRDLTADGAAIELFKATDAPWVAGQRPYTQDDIVYVTDGPELFRTRTGKLIMLWSSWGVDGYVQSQARSLSGEIQGPWEQLPELLHQDSGHGMLFRTFEGQLMLVVHRPFRDARGKLYDMRDAGDGVEIVRQRKDLDGDP